MKIFSHQRFEQEQLSHKDKFVQISVYYWKLSVFRLVISLDKNAPSSVVKDFSPDVRILSTGMMEALQESS